MESLLVRRLVWRRMNPHAPIRNFVVAVNGAEVSMDALVNVRRFRKEAH